MLVIHVVVWAVAMGLFQMAQQTGNDLWGYSCGNVADEIQAAVTNFLDFGKLCTVQVSKIYSSLDLDLYLSIFLANTDGLVDGSLVFCSPRSGELLFSLRGNSAKFREIANEEKDYGTYGGQPR